MALKRNDALTRARERLKLNAPDVAQLPRPVYRAHIYKYRIWAYFTTLTTPTNCVDIYLLNAPEKLTIGVFYVFACISVHTYI